MAIHSHWFTLPVPCIPRTMKLEGPHKQSIKGAKRKGKCTNRPIRQGHDKSYLPTWNKYSWLSVQWKPAGSQFKGCTLGNY